MEQIRNKKQKQMIHDIQELLKQGKSIDVVSSTNKVSLVCFSTYFYFNLLCKLKLSSFLKIKLPFFLLHFVKKFT